MSTKPGLSRTGASNPAINTRPMTAAANFVIAMDAGLPVYDTELAVLYEAFTRMFGGESPASVWGVPSTLNPGFTVADRVSAFIELELRSDQKKRGSIRRAQDKAADAFSMTGDNAIKQVERYWRDGKKMVAVLNIDELQALLHGLVAKTVNDENL